jgi:hypothetical protein
LTTSPSIDGSAAIRTSGSSTNVNLTTTVSGDLICVVVTTLGASVTVSSVTATGLTFTKVQSIVQNSSGTFNMLDLWTAVASGTLSSKTITVTLSASVFNLSMSAFGVTGLFSTSTPYDPNVLTPLTTAANPITALSITTTNADDLLLYLATAQSANGNGGAPTGFTQFASEGGTGFVDILCNYKSVSATQSGTSVVTSSTPSAGCAMLTAFTADTSIVSFNVSVSESGDAEDSPSEDFLAIAAVTETVAAADSVTAALSGSLMTVEQNGWGFIIPDTTSSDMSLTTLHANDLIVLVYSVAGDGDGPVISSISSPTGLSAWTQRKTFYDASNDIHTEVWWASAASPIDGDTFTVSFASAIPSRGANLVDFFVTGANISAPFDSNASLPAIATITSRTPSISGLSTTNAFDLVFSYMSAVPPNLGLDGLPTGPGTLLINVTDANTVNGTNTTSVATELVVNAISAPLSDATETWVTTDDGVSGNGLIYFDAITFGKATLTASITETMAGIDVAGETLEESGGTFLVNLRDALAATDATAGILILTTSITETMDAADTADRTLVFPASLTETMTAAEHSQVVIPHIVNETMHAVDSPDRTIIHTAAITEAGNASDTVRSGINLVVTEILDAVDVAGEAVEGPTGTFLLSARDTLTATDAASSASHRSASVVETMHAADSTNAGTDGVFSVSVIEAGHLVATQTEHMRTNSTVQDILSATDHASGIVTTTGHAGIFNLSIREAGNLVDHIGEAQTFTTPGLYFWNYLYAYPGTMSCWIAGLDCGDFAIAPDGSVFVPWKADPDGLFTPAWLMNLANNPPENGFGPLACNVDLTTNTGTILRLVVSAAIGLTYTSRVQLLAPNSPELSHSQFGPSFGTTRRLHQYAARVVNAGQMKVGTRVDRLLPVQFRQPNGGKYPASQLFTGTHWDQVDDDYSYDGELMVEIDRPYPATITALGGFMKTSDRD